MVIEEDLPGEFKPRHVSHAGGLTMWSGNRKKGSLDHMAWKAGKQDAGD